jgi:hypothetical protein
MTGRPIVGAPACRIERELLPTAPAVLAAVLYGVLDATVTNGGARSCVPSAGTEHGPTTPVAVLAAQGAEA